MTDAQTAPYRKNVADFLEHHFATSPSLPKGQVELLKSIRYSLLQEGGKRFRPLLSQLTAEALGVEPNRVLPFAAAVECVHTYSLIHDDLPAMDDDDLRRGQPTNHKVFGEAMAVLAGDALLSEAFQILVTHYGSEPTLAVNLVGELARAVGCHGMVAGQALDIKAKQNAMTLAELETLHELKTGALIRVSVTGAGLVCGVDPEQLKELTDYAKRLGLAFQVADDLLDFTPAEPEAGSYASLLGVEKSRAFLDELTDLALAALSEWPPTAEPLRSIARANSARQF